jgi:ribonucleoside-diphosphate reductase alpha chain
VLEVTAWPLEQQRKEAMAKRRVGLGFTGLGDALIMLRLKYDTDEARRMAATISESMRDAAYRGSVELARERGAFPLFNADLYLSGTSFATRLPASIKQLIKQHGLRNSHLLSIAPTGTISLAFADNASNGIEPPFSWTYTRKKRMPDGTMKEFPVEDHAWRRYKSMGGDVDNLPPYFVTALELSARAHEQMVAAVAPYIDTSISKTVNVAEDYPYAEFENLYMKAWKYAARYSDKRGSVQAWLMIMARNADGSQYWFSKPDSGYDTETRWAIAWFDQYGMDEGPFGTAETLSKAKVTSVSGLSDGRWGILRWRRRG